MTKHFDFGDVKIPEKKMYGWHSRIYGIIASIFYVKKLKNRKLRKLLQVTGQ